VTVVGTFDSLKALLADLCSKTNVALKSFDAPDHPVTATQTKRPLTEVIERLLSSENYLLGVRGSEAAGAPMRVAWIRVTGAKDSGAGVVSGGIAVPSEFGTTDFKQERPADVNRAEKAVADRLLADDAHVARLLKVEPRELAQSLRQYPHIDVLLRKLRAEQRHPAVVEKLDAVIHELDSMSASPAD
jgi:hypothetical protein